VKNTTTCILSKKPWEIIVPQFWVKEYRRLTDLLDSRRISASVGGSRHSGRNTIKDSGSCDSASKFWKTINAMPKLVNKHMIQVSLYEKSSLYGQSSPIHTLWCPKNLARLMKIQIIKAYCKAI